MSETTKSRPMRHILQDLEDAIADAYGLVDGEQPRGSWPEAREHLERALELVDEAEALQKEGRKG